MLCRPFGDGSFLQREANEILLLPHGTFVSRLSLHSKNYLKYSTSKHSFCAITVLLKPYRNSVLSE